MLVYYAHPIDSAPASAHDGVPLSAPSAPSALASLSSLPSSVVYDPARAIICRHPIDSADVIISINTRVLALADYVLACLDPPSIGVAREVEQAVHNQTPVFAWPGDMPSPYAHDCRIRLFPDMQSAVSALMLALMSASAPSAPVPAPGASTSAPSPSSLSVDEADEAAPLDMVAVGISAVVEPVNPSSPYWFPERHFDGDCGFDLYVSADTSIPAGVCVDVPTNIKVQLPESTWGFIVGRSSTIRSRCLQVMPGIIDNGYRGELFTCVLNLNADAVVVKKGERLAQLIVMPLLSPFLLEGVVTGTDRGDQGFGSTGQ